MNDLFVAPIPDDTSSLLSILAISRRSMYTTRLWNWSAHLVDFKIKHIPGPFVEMESCWQLAVRAGSCKCSTLGADLSSVSYLDTLVRCTASPLPMINFTCYPAETMLPWGCGIYRLENRFIECQVTWIMCGQWLSVPRPMISMLQEGMFLSFFFLASLPIAAYLSLCLSNYLKSAMRKDSQHSYSGWWNRCQQIYIYIYVFFCHVGLFIYFLFHLLRLSFSFIFARQLRSQMQNMGCSISDMCCNHGSWCPHRISVVFPVRYVVIIALNVLFNSCV